MAVGRGSTESTEGRSGPMQRVLDALIEGVPVSVTDQAELSPTERDEIAQLVRTAHLTRLVLHADDPPPTAESASLTKVQATLRTRLVSGALPTPPSTAREPSAWQRLLRRFQGNRGENSR